MSLRSIQARERNETASSRNRQLESALGSRPLGAVDGFIEPTSWEGKPIPARKWIVRDMIPCGCCTMVTGNGGDGKSLLTMQLLAAGSTRSRWLGKSVLPIRGLGIYCEDEKDELHRRTYGVLSGQGLSFSALDDLGLVSRKGKDNVMFEAQKNEAIGRTTSFFERVRATAIDLGAQLLVLDSLYNFFAGDENNKHHTLQFIHALESIAVDIDGAVVIVAHPSKSGMGDGGDGTSGSVAWHNAVRSRLYLHREKPDAAAKALNARAKGPLILQPMKGNYAPEQDAIEIVYEQGRFVPVANPHRSNWQDNED